MQFRGLERFKTKYPRWSTLIEQLDEYLSEISQRPEGFDEVLSPALLAKRLDIPYSWAVALLGFADDAGIVRPSYVVYSPDHWELGRFSSESEIPEQIYSEEEDRAYNTDELPVDLVFEFEGEEGLEYA